MTFVAAPGGREGHLFDIGVRAEQASVTTVASSQIPTGALMTGR